MKIERINPGLTIKLIPETQTEQDALWSWMNADSGGHCFSDIVIKAPSINFDEAEFGTVVLDRK